MTDNLIQAYFEKNAKRLKSKVMELTLTRLKKHAQEQSTIGVLQVEGTLFRCWTCEDLERTTKIQGKTAIPQGRYKVILSLSNRFKRVLPLLVNVPNFEGIRIHPGNTSEDTEGCILLGIERINGTIQKSKITCDFFQNLLETAENDIYITIKSATNEQDSGMA